MNRKSTPFWLKRLSLVRKECRTISWPRTVEAGFRQGLALMAWTLIELRRSIKTRRPKASDAQVDQEISRLMIRWAVADKKFAIGLKGKGR